MSVPLLPENMPFPLELIAENNIHGLVEAREANIKSRTKVSLLEHKTDRDDPR